jgi:hypothetical protein
MNDASLLGCQTVVGCVFRNVPKDHNAFSPSSQLSISTKNGLLNPKGEGNYTPDNTSQPI